MKKIKKPIKGFEREEIIQFISEIEKDINAVSLITDKCSMEDLCYELIALDYQRSLFKNGERVYYSHPFMETAKNSMDRCWTVYNPESDDYKEVVLGDMIEKNDDIRLNQLRLPPK
tara:strand:+ start:257 stop:604 length:348 start_codon:yes stop_codon:yes gene_type:complete